MTRKEIRAAFTHGPFVQAPGGLQMPAGYERWTEVEFGLGEEILHERVAEQLREAENLEWMTGLVRKLCPAFEDRPLSEAIPHMPELERQMVQDICREKTAWEHLPFECRAGFRQPWHDTVEWVLKQYLSSQTPSFSSSDVLNAAKIPPSDRDAALRYVKALMNCYCGRIAVRRGVNERQ